jgi:hypothetical protein
MRKTFSDTIEGVRRGYKIKTSWPDKALSCRMSRVNRQFPACARRSGMQKPRALPSNACAKLNNVDPQAWLTDVIRRIVDHKINRIDE